MTGNKTNTPLNPIPGIMFMLAGGAFFVAAALSGAVAFYGVGTSMIGVGVVFVALARKGGPK